MSFIEEILGRIQEKSLPREREGEREGRDCRRCEEQGQCVRVCPSRVQRLLEVGPDRIGATLGVGPVAKEIARIIDHTLLKPEATLEDIRLLCAEAAFYGFKTVCVNSCWTSTCRKLLENYPVGVCTVVGFPLGACLPDVKAYEAKRAVEEGAVEIDMVMNIGALKGGHLDFVEEDIRAVVEAAKVPVKVILETCLLTDGEKTIACQIAKNAGAAFVKTSTGFNKGGATVEDVRLMRRVVGDSMGVKASGGIRTLEKAVAMVEAGANRIGASASVQIVRGTGEKKE